MEIGEFAKCMAVLASGVGREMPDEMVEVWYQVLGDLSVGQLRRGIVEALRTHKFAGFPPVGVIRDLSIGPQEQRALSGQDRAVAVWSRVHEALSRVGGYESPDFGDPVCHATIRTLGGWIQITAVETDKVTWLRKEFIETYRAIEAAGVPGEMAAPLVGINNQSLSAAGYETEPARPVDMQLPGQRPGIVKGPAATPALPRSLVRRLAAQLADDPTRDAEREAKAARMQDEEAHAAERARQLEILAKRGA